MKYFATTCLPGGTKALALLLVLLAHFFGNLTAVAANTLLENPITYTQIPDTHWQGVPLSFELEAEAPGGPVTFRIDVAPSGGATLEGETLHVSKPGFYLIAMLQAGGNGYRSSAEHMRFTVGYTVTINNPPVGGKSFIHFDLHEDPSRTIFRPGERLDIWTRTDPGYRLLEWQGDLSGSNYRPTLTVSGDMQITPVFVEDWELSLGLGSNKTSFREGKRISSHLEFKSPGGVAHLFFEVQYDSVFLDGLEFDCSTRIQADATVTAVDTGSALLITIDALPGEAIPAGGKSLGNVITRARSVDEELKTLSLQITNIQMRDVNGVEMQPNVEIKNRDLEIVQRAWRADINGNQLFGACDVGDVLLLRDLLTQDLSERPWDVTLNDLNNDGQLNETDLERLIEVVLGIADHVPVDAAPPEPAPAIDSISEPPVGESVVVITPPPIPPEVIVEVAPGLVLPGRTLWATIKVEKFPGCSLRPWSSGDRGYRALHVNCRYPGQALQLSLADIEPGDRFPDGVDDIVEWHLSEPDDEGYRTLQLLVVADEALEAVPGILARLPFQVLSGARAMEHVQIRVTRFLFSQNGYELCYLWRFKSPHLPVPRRFDVWQQDYGLTGSPASGQDYDGDGAPDFLEYAFGGDPRDAGALPQIQASRHASTIGNSIFTLTYKAQRLASDLCYKVWSSDDLKNWHVIYEHQSKLEPAERVDEHARPFTTSSGNPGTARSLSPLDGTGMMEVQIWFSIREEAARYYKVTVDSLEPSP